MPKDNEAQIRARFVALRPVMDERMRRLWAGAEASALGGGGIAAVERATGLSRTTIRAGRNELVSASARREGREARVRRVGGGRRLLEESAPDLSMALDTIIQGTPARDPALIWTRKSAVRLQQELAESGYRVSVPKVRQLLSALGYQRLGSVVERAESSHGYDEQLKLLGARVAQCIDHGLVVVFLRVEAGFGRSRGQLKNMLIDAAVRLKEQLVIGRMLCLTPLATVSGLTRSAWEQAVHSAAERSGMAIWAAQIPPAIVRVAGPEVSRSARSSVVRVLGGHNAEARPSSDRATLEIFDSWRAPSAEQGWYADLNTVFDPWRPSPGARLGSAS